MKIRNPVVPDGCNPHDPNSLRSGGSMYLAAGH